MLSKSQSQRMDDQRTTLPHTLSISSKASEAAPSSSSEEEDFVDILCRMQGARIEDQRCAFVPHLMPADQEEDEEEEDEEEEEEDEHVDPEELFDLIFHCQVREERPSVLMACAQEAILSHPGGKHQYKHCLICNSQENSSNLHPHTTEAAEVIVSDAAVLHSIVRTIAQYQC